MIFEFGKPLSLRLSQLEHDANRIPVDAVKGMCKNKFGRLSPFFQRALAGKYDAAFIHYNKERDSDDVAYTFRNEHEIVFAGYFRRNNRSDIGLLGISIPGESSYFDTPSLATPHASVENLVYGMRRGVIFSEPKDQNFGVPDVELYLPGTQKLPSRERDLKPILDRFSGLEYRAKLGESLELTLDSYQ